MSAESMRVMRPLFQAEEGGATPTSALSLYFAPCELDFARQLNRLWHSRLPGFTNPIARACYTAEADGLAYAAAIWKNPMSRLLPQTTWLELARLAVAPDAPRNTASRMLGWMARDIRVRFPEVVRLISYQDTEVHTGAIYRAAGWSPVVMADPRSRPWNNASRSRNREQSAAPKQRWEKVIRG